MLSAGNTDKWKIKGSTTTTQVNEVWSPRIQCRHIACCQTILSTRFKSTKFETKVYYIITRQYKQNKHQLNLYLLFPPIIFKTAEI